MKRPIATGVLLALLGAVWAFAALRSMRSAKLRVVDPKLSLPADGRFHGVGLLVSGKGNSVKVSGVSVSGLPARVSETDAGKTELAVQSPVLPGERTIRISSGSVAATLRLHFTDSLEDSVGNGTPDFLRLHTAEDRNAFRGWFVSLAEAAADLPPEKLPHEIDDCAALLRWCYRNALHAHDEGWLSGAPMALDLAKPSVRQYAYPLTPLGAGLFRVREGAFTAGDISDGAFAQFADARTLWRLNTFLLGRNVRSARPGDLLFFRQLEQNSPYHSMIVAGDGQKEVIYHTGPIGSGPGEMRRVLLRELLHHPDPRWRPVPENSNFLGVYRWNILEEDPR